MSRAKRVFSPEFREDAVRLVIESSRPIASVARELQIGEGTLGNWVSVYRRDHAGEEPGLNVSDQARLRELERKYREVKLENEFLKKAALGSGGRRNAFGQCSSGCRVAQGFPGAGIQFGGNGVEVALGVAG